MNSSGFGDRFQVSAALYLYRSDSRYEWNGHEEPLCVDVDEVHSPTRVSRRARVGTTKALASGHIAVCVMINISTLSTFVSPALLALDLLLPFSNYGTAGGTRKPRLLD